MTCRICLAKSDAFRQAALIALGEDDGTSKFVPSPNSRCMSGMFFHKSDMHASAALSHEDDFHDPPKVTFDNWQTTHTGWNYKPWQANNG